MRTTSALSASLFPSVLLAVVWGLISAPSLSAQPTLDGYLPGDGDHDPAIPVPSSVLGFEVGEWHVRPDQSLRYMEVLAEASERAVLEIQSHTYERRPQPLLIVTSPENQARLDDLVAAQLQLADPTAHEIDDKLLAAQPVFVFLGFSIHGNEASGANAALLTAYHLVASRSPEVENWLEHAVVLIDPMLNPDGLGRFAHWANTQRATGPIVADSQSREHNEPWPGGRTNHYWFDLNRDWLLLQHPESRGRVATLRRFEPNLIGDFHEMGTDNTFFFQPGIPIRKNPLIPERNVEITQGLARYHAESLDREDRLYYTEESFDDFYPGKGSTYPDLQGAVGVLFEQASARGHAQESANGLLTFPYGIENQFLASLSMVRGAVELRDDFHRHRVDFYREAAEEADDDARAGFVFTTPHDPARSREMVRILLGHGIRVHRLERPLELDGTAFEPSETFVVPTEQRQYVLVRSLFETRTEFADSAFYDVSTWTLPLAFDADWAELPRVQAPAIGDPLDAAPALEGDLVSESSETPFAWVIDGRGSHAIRALDRLQRGGVQVRLATTELELRTDAGPLSLPAGSLIVSSGVQANAGLDVEESLRRVAEQTGVEAVAIREGLQPGTDIGSPSIRPLVPPRIALLAGPGASGYEVGELWHLLDHRYGVEVTVLDLDRVVHSDLDRYTHIVLTDGFYGRFDETFEERIGAWVRDGGTLVTVGGGAAWAQEKVLGRPLEDEEEAREPDPDPERRTYGTYRAKRAEQLLAGTIVAGELDPTHPLAWGYTDAELPLFRTDARILAASENPYENVAYYAEDPLVSGYISDENRERLGGRVALMASRHGGGLVVQFLDNPNFRAYFQGPNRLFLNALFYSSAIEATTAPEAWVDTEAIEE